MLLLFSFLYPLLFRLEEARQVLQKIRPADADIDGEVEAIMDAASNDVEEES